MNRNKAKLLTFGGIIGCAVSTILLIWSLAAKIEVSPLIAVLFFAGVILIIFSLAYYTEK